MSAIDVTSLVVTRDRSPVVSAVDLAVPAGCWFGLIGANGSGKTSLLRAIAGRLPIAAGRCLIDGDDLSGDRGARARRIGFAPPADRLPDTMRVGELFEISAGSLGAAYAAMGPVRHALSVDGLQKHWIGACSAGMRQRVSIALAFANPVRITLLDEPFNWLDPVAAYDLHLACRDLVAQGHTIVTALHDLGVVPRICDRGAMLGGGRVVMDLDTDRLARAARDPDGFERDLIGRLRDDTRHPAR